MNKDNNVEILKLPLAKRLFQFGVLELDNFNLYFVDGVDR